ncbi:Uncharacterized protein Fot_07038 [Forsythia ovata]|uniref:Uncharacterized protein n=1 Tax=Forsythia ovata TaxID=205694 RepID=A0ABD1WL01_9LAMI
MDEPEMGGKVEGISIRWLKIVLSISNITKFEDALEKNLSLNVGGGDSFLTVGSYNPGEFSSPAATEDFSEEQLPLYLGKYLVYECKREGFIEEVEDEVGKGCNIHGSLEVNKVPA